MCNFPQYNFCQNSSLSVKRLKLYLVADKTYLRPIASNFIQSHNLSIKVSFGQNIKVLLVFWKKAQPNL
jgi:hypothetical protein